MLTVRSICSKWWSTGIYVIAVFVMPTRGPSECTVDCQYSILLERNYQTLRLAPRLNCSTSAGRALDARAAPAADLDCRAGGGVPLWHGLRDTPARLGSGNAGRPCGHQWAAPVGAWRRLAPGDDPRRGGVGAGALGRQRGDGAGDRRAVARGMPGIARLAFEVVDVRDLADVQIWAMTAEQAAGERFIAVSEFMWNKNDERRRPGLNVYRCVSFLSAA
jgi:hypothetical protein